MSARVILRAHKKTETQRSTRRIVNDIALALATMGVTVHECTNDDNTVGVEYVSGQGKTAEPVAVFDTDDELRWYSTDENPERDALIESHCKLFCVI